MCTWYEILIYNYNYCVYNNIGTPYDPKDNKLSQILLKNGKFESFYYNKNEDDLDNKTSKTKPFLVRPAHHHGTFYKYRNPALVQAKNAAAYGYRFDGGRRFNYDR